MVSLAAGFQQFTIHRPDVYRSHGRALAGLRRFPHQFIKAHTMDKQPPLNPGYKIWLHPLLLQILLIDAILSRGLSHIGLAKLMHADFFLHVLVVFQALVDPLF